MRGVMPLSGVASGLGVHLESQCVKNVPATEFIPCSLISVALTHYARPGMTTSGTNFNACAQRTNPRSSKVTN